MRGDLERRLDPFFYIPSLVALERKVLHKKPFKLRHYINSISSGATPSIGEFEKYYADKDTGYPFVRVQNLNPTGELSLEDLKYINSDTHNIYLKRSQVKEGDLIVKITGVGRMAIASIPPAGFVGNINQHSVVIKTNNELTSKILAAFLNSDIGEKLATKRATGGTRPALDYTALKSIPIIFDKNILELFEKAKIEKQKKEQEAQNLLDGIDGFLFSQLGIQLPKNSTNSLKTRIFQTNWGKLSGNRFDPKKYSTETESLYNAINKTSFPTVRLKALITHSKAGDWGKDENESLDNNLYRKCLVIRATEFDNNYNLKLDNSRVKYRMVSIFKLDLLDIKENDFLIEKSGGSIDQPVGRIALLDKEVLSSGNIAYSNFIHKFRIDEAQISPDYLFCFLKSIHNIKLTDTMQSQTNGIRNLILREYWNQVIPLPTLEIQTKIANEALSRRYKAKRIFSQAQVEFEIAKKKIDQMILA
jgi:restriction endonuclease S subunit